MQAKSCKKRADAAFFRVPVSRSTAFMLTLGKLLTRIRELDAAGRPSN